MGSIVRFHALASAGSGRGMPAGQGSSAGQLSENQRIVRSSRSTVMPADPASMASSFLPSLSACELTVENLRFLQPAYTRATVKRLSVPDMPLSIGKITRLSTAKLPRGQNCSIGYSTGMELRDIVTWVDARLKATGLSDRSAGKKAGHQYAITNMRRTLKNGAGSLPKVKTLADLAKVLGDPPAGLLDVVHTVGAAEPLGPMRAPTDLELLEAELADIRAREVRILSAIAEIKAARKAG